MQKYANTVTDTLGNVVSLASVSVYTDAGHTTLATVYSDNGITPTTNPRVTDSLGNFSFYAADGRYYIKVTKSGVTTQFLDDVILFDPTASTSAASINTVQSGTGAVSTDSQSKMRWNTVSPLDFMSDALRADVTGLSPTLDHTPYILIACAQALLQGKGVHMGGYVWLLKTQLALTAAHRPMFFGDGYTIEKGFNGDAITVTNCPNLAFHGTYRFEWNHGTFTGKGIVVSGVGSTDPFFGPGGVSSACTDTHIEIGADSGTWAKIACNFKPGSGQTDYRAVHIKGPDTSARHRTFYPHVADSGYHQLDGALGFYSAGVACRRFAMDTASSVISINGGSWASTPTAIVIKGTILHIVGIRMSGDISFDSNATGHFAHNEQTSGTFSSAGISDGMTLFHRNTTTGLMHVGRNTLYAFPGSTENIVTSRITSLPSADVTLTVGTQGPTVVFGAVLTAAVAVSLSTSGAVPGHRFRVVREATATGAFNLNVGTGPLKVLATASLWCDVEFDGSAWRLTGTGPL